MLFLHFIFSYFDLKLLVIVEGKCQRICINSTTIKIKNRQLLEVFCTEETHTPNIARKTFLFLMSTELPGQNNLLSSLNFLTEMRPEPSCLELLTSMKMPELPCQMLGLLKNFNNSSSHLKDTQLTNNSGRY